MKEGIRDYIVGLGADDIGFAKVEDYQRPASPPIESLPPGTRSLIVLAFREFSAVDSPSPQMAMNGRLDVMEYSRSIGYRLARPLWDAGHLHRGAHRPGAPFGSASRSESLHWLRSVRRSLPVRGSGRGGQDPSGQVRGHQSAVRSARQHRLLVALRCGGPRGAQRYAPQPRVPQPLPGGIHRPAVLLLPLPGCLPGRPRLKPLSGACGAGKEG